MPIPPLRPDGRLPSGEHHATLAEIYAAFPSKTVERQALDQALEDFVEICKQLRGNATDMVVYIDGSYITRKAAPGDIDILVLTDVYDEDQIQENFSQRYPHEADLLDIFVDSPSRPLMLAFYQLTRKGKSKGIIVLDF